MAVPSSNALLMTVDGTPMVWSDAVVDYVFPTTNSFRFDVYSNYRALTAAEQTAAVQAMALWADVAGVSFREGVNAWDVDLRFGAADLVGMSGVTWVQYMIGSPNTVTYGDLFLDRDAVAAGMGLGGWGWHVLVHELGHVVGLEHPRDYDGEEAPHWSVADDTLRNSVMSYVDFAGHADVYPWTPTIYDIQAVQSLYGAASGTRAGDTVYGFNSTAGHAVFSWAADSRPVVALWDGGGSDTLDLSGFAQPSWLSLEAGAYSSVAGLTDNLAIAFGTVIENAITGGGNDWVLGNAAANRLVGGAGSDALSGGRGNDILEGGDGNDWLKGDDDNDVVYGGDGNDGLLGGSGSDALYAGAGDDRLWGGSGRDWLKGEDGNDTLRGEDDADGLLGGAGSDDMDGGAGDDRLWGDAGNDWMKGGLGNDVLYGGSGRDGLRGDAGSDHLEGGDDADRLWGEAGNDWMKGDGGDDTLWGGAGRDGLVGGLGDDLLIGGGDADRLWGGAGADRFRFEAPAEGGDAIGDFVSGEDILELVAGAFGVTAGAATAGGTFAVIGALYDGANGAGTAWASGADAFIYDSAGALYYDADGAAEGYTLVASLGAGTVLEADDLVFV